MANLVEIVLASGNQDHHSKYKYAIYPSDVTGCLGLQENEPQTTYPMSKVFVSHTADIKSAQSISITFEKQHTQNYT